MKKLLFFTIILLGSQAFAKKKEAPKLLKLADNSLVCPAGYETTMNETIWVCKKRSSKQINKVDNDRQTVFYEAAKIYNSNSLKQQGLATQAQISILIDPKSSEEEGQFAIITLEKLGSSMQTGLNEITAKSLIKDKKHGGGVNITELNSLVAKIKQYNQDLSARPELEGLGSLMPIYVCGDNYKNI